MKSQPIFAKNGAQFLQTLNGMYDNGRGYPAKADEKSLTAKAGEYPILYSTTVDGNGYLKCKMPQTREELDSLIKSKSKSKLQNYKLLLISDEKTFTDTVSSTEWVA